MIDFGAKIVTIKELQALRPDEWSSSDFLKDWEEHAKTRT